jgi:hypothetical protein
VTKEKAIIRGLPWCLEPRGIVSLHIAANDSGLAKLSDSPSDAERGFQSKGRRNLEKLVEWGVSVRFAEACGGVGFACTRPEEVRPALEAAWRIADRPALVEATIDNDADVSPPEDYLSGA